MAGLQLQRSAVSFRRQGSSGLIWDDRFLSGELKRPNRNEPKETGDIRELRASRSVGSVSTFQRNRSTGGRTAHPMESISPSPSPCPTDPPSPRFGRCGFCGVFSRPAGLGREKPNKRRTK